MKCAIQYGAFFLTRTVCMYLHTHVFTNGTCEGFVQSVGEDGLSQVAQKILDNTTHHVHITHLAGRGGRREIEKGEREGESNRQAHIMPA